MSQKTNCDFRLTTRQPQIYIILIYIIFNHSLKMTSNLLTELTYIILIHFRRIPTGGRAYIIAPVTLKISGGTNAIVCDLHR